MTSRPAAYIVAARRTPIGKFMGGLARVPARIERAACMTASRPEPQTLFTVTALIVSGRPD